MTLPAYVGRYRVRHEIAVGGFAAVVQAWDEELESLVALKILHGELAKDEQLRERFLEEARLLRRIRAPNVITVHDVGRLNDGRPYFVLDFADRGTLEGRLASLTESTLREPQYIVALVDAIADGLAAIHDAGLVHRDIKPANILFQRMRRGPLKDESDLAQLGDTLVARAVLVDLDERVLVGDLGIAKDLINRGRLPTIVGGTPFYQAPEQSDPAAVVSPAADVYAATAILWQILTARKPPGAHALAKRLAALPDIWHPVFERGMAAEVQDRFADVESWRVAVQETLAGVAAEGHVVARKPAVSQAVCPYKGLAAYQPEDAHLFWGREALIDELVRRTQRRQVLVVGGPSGSGKSSLVRAGLIPALGAGALTGSEGWNTVLFTPGRDPLAELHFQMTRQLTSLTPSLSLENLLARPTLARHLGALQQSNPTWVLVIDQLEELFTLASETQRSQFFTALSAMTDPADSKVRLVLAVRADFYGECAQIPWLAERITDNQVLVGPMTRAELRRAISEPARRAGLYLERGLVEAIVDETSDEVGSLPLVAHALVETWIRREGNKLTLEGFRTAGGVTGAISQTADATYENSFDADERIATKRLFLRLVNPGEGTPDTRRLLPRDEIDSYPDAEVLHKVVNTLTDARLLTLDEVSVQIAHEALLGTWPRLRTWIEESRDDLRLRQRISRAAAEWNAENRDPDLLYRGTPLLSALEWAEGHHEHLGKLDRDFLDACAETKAREEAVAAERQRKTRRLRGVAVSLLVLLTVSASLASVVAFMAFHEAQRNEERATLATLQAQARFAGALGSAAYGHVQEDPLLALFLAAESVARAKQEPPAYDARAALLAARQVLTGGGPFVLRSPVSAGDAMAVALNADGTVLAIAQRNGDIDLMDTATHELVGTSLRGHDGGVRDLKFDPLNRWLTSAGTDGTVRLWSLEANTRGEGRTLGEADDVIMGVSVDPNGAVIASANGNGTVQLWDVARSKALSEPLAQLPLAFKVIAFSSDGEGLLAGYNDGTIHAWNLVSREPLFAPLTEIQDSNPSDLAMSPAGSLFATASTDGTSTLVDYPSGRVRGRAFDGTPITTVVFAPDGKLVFGGGKDGSVKLWDVDAQRLVGETARGHSEPIVDTELNRRGDFMATLGRDQLIRFWNVGRAYPLGEARRVAGRSAKSVAFSPDGRYLAAGDSDGMIQIWDTHKHNEPRLLRGHAQQIWALAYTRAGDLLASGDRTGQVRLWDTAKGVALATIPADETVIWSLVFSPDGQRLISTSDTQVQAWDPASGESLGRFTHETGRLTRAAMASNGELLATTATDGRVRVWELESGDLLREISADDDILWSVAFSPDARQLATASGDEIVALWDVRTGTREATFVGHTGGAVDVAYLADGVTLVAADRTGGLHWWDTHTARRLAEPQRAHQRASWRLAVHPRGDIVATAGDDGLVKVWDQLSVQRACELGAAAVDAVRRRQYLGEAERSIACGEVSR